MGTDLSVAGMDDTPAPNIRFEPALPKLKLQAIRRLGYGLLNKLVLLFPAVFWDDTLDTFGHVNPIGGGRSEGVLHIDVNAMIHHIPSLPT